MVEINSTIIIHPLAVVNIKKERLTNLSFAQYPKHSGSASWTFTFHCFSAIFHCNFNRSFDFFFRLTFYAIAFHDLINLIIINLFQYKYKFFVRCLQIVSFSSPGYSYPVPAQVWSCHNKYNIYLFSYLY